jgi:hypothetical protein
MSNLYKIERRHDNQHLKPIFALTDILESLPRLRLSMPYSPEPPSSLEKRQGLLADGMLSPFLIPLAS